MGHPRSLFPVHFPAHRPQPDALTGSSAPDMAWRQLSEEVIPLG